MFNTFNYILTFRHHTHTYLRNFVLHPWVYIS